MEENLVGASLYAYPETIERLTQAIAVAGATLFATIDQSAAARGAGLELRPTTLLVFGNPKGGTPLMVAFPLVALDLPLKLLIWEDAGRVNVAYTPMRVVAARYALTGYDAQLAGLDRALQTLTAAVL
jgi:uncharacterized protein (DUF302 family)